MQENQINELVSLAIEKIKSVADVNSVIGVPFETKEGTLVFPLTKLSVGFVAGGGEYGASEKVMKNAEKFPFAGGSGAGVSMHPVGLLTIKNDQCKLIRIDEKSPYEKLVETIPDVISQISKFFNNGDKNGEK